MAPETCYMQGMSQSDTNPVYVSLEFTPNPNTLKYSVNRQLLAKGAANFTSKAEADAGSILASRLFGVPGVSGVMIGKDFVTVTKNEEGDWDVVHKTASGVIEQALASGTAVVNEGVHNDGPKGGDTEAEKKIRNIIDTEIRPAVAMDGGDITFEKFEDGVVYVYLQGSCAGCPSSTMTLKMGIENRLKQAVPEVREVVSV